MNKNNVCENGISPNVISKLKAENTLHNMRKATAAKIHKPSVCCHCRDNFAAMATDDFVKKKVALVRRKQMDERLEEANRRCNDPLYLMGEIVKDLPDIKTNPHVINQKLLKPLEARNYSTKSARDHPLKDYYPEETRLFWKEYFAPLKNHVGKGYMNFYDD